MSRWAAATDEQLLIAASDREAFSAFYRRYEGPVLAFFRRRTREPELAADLAAETFAAALTSCRRFRAGKAPASAWLFSIAHHKLAHSRRRGAVENRARRRLGMPTLLIDDEELHRIDLLGFNDGEVTALLDSLPPDQQGRLCTSIKAPSVAAAGRGSPSHMRTGRPAATHWSARAQLPSARRSLDGSSSTSRAGQAQRGSPEDVVF